MNEAQIKKASDDIAECKNRILDTIGGDNAVIAVVAIGQIMIESMTFPSLDAEFKNNFINALISDLGIIQRGVTQ